MENRDLLLELAKHLRPNEIAKLACLNRETNRLVSQEMVWKNMYEHNFCEHLDYYQTYQENFKLAWSWLHPRTEYSIMLTAYDDELPIYSPLCVFNTTNIEYILDNLGEISQSDKYYYLVHEYGIPSFDDMTRAQITRTFQEKFVLKSVPVYEYPEGGGEAMKKVFCFYYYNQNGCKCYGCFLGADREEILKILAFILNIDDKIVGEKCEGIFFDNSDPRPEYVEIYPEITNRLRNRCIAADDIKYIVDLPLEFDQGVYRLRKVLFCDVGQDKN